MSYMKRDNKGATDTYNQLLIFIHFLVANSGLSFFFL
jgi:hypothetical protein